jgi:hypothetical protein
MFPVRYGQLHLSLCLVQIQFHDEHSSPLFVERIPLRIQASCSRDQCEKGIMFLQTCILHLIVGENLRIF